MNPHHWMLQSSCAVVSGISDLSDLNACADMAGLRSCREQRVFGSQCFQSRVCDQPAGMLQVCGP
jgi:hypothetical protein